jgi:hypothetical protein
VPRSLCIPALAVVFSTHWKTPTRIPGEEGLRDMKILFAAYDPAKSGKPVRLA